MKILLDECVRYEVVGLLSDLGVKHVRDVGWASLQNGELINAADSEFDALVTVDKKVRFQQSLRGRRLMVVILDVPDVEVNTYGRFLPKLRQCMEAAKPGEFVLVTDPTLDP